MKILIVTIVCIFLSSGLLATNVQVANVASNGTSTVTFDISWENSWRSINGQRDAVWIVLKGSPNGSGTTHLGISTVTPETGFDAIITDDDVGFMLERTSVNIGDVNTSVSLTYTTTSPGTYMDVRVLAMEMVFVPYGGFAIGDGVATNRYHRGDDSSIPFQITSNFITRGTAVNQFDGGPLNHTGDVGGLFPIGLGSFYCMKYPVTESQFVDFLNSLSRSAQDFHTASNLSGTFVSTRYVMSNTSTNTFGQAIRCDANIGTGNITFYCDSDPNNAPNENTDGLGRVCRWLNMHNYYAYLDWIGLAPMTSFEYEKACRGTLQPVPGEFAWGSTLMNTGGTIVDAGQPSEKLSNSGVDGGILEDLTTTLRVGCHAPTTGATRELANASYFGIHGLTGRAVTLVMPATDIDYYVGQKGDGELDINGRADFMDDTHVLMLKQYYTTGSGTVSGYTGVTFNDQFGATKAIQGVRRLFN